MPQNDPPTKARSGPLAAPGVQPRAVVVPATMQQLQVLEFFDGGQAPEAFQQTWINRRALLIQPRLDANRVARAVQTVIARHESLRMRFVHENGQWGVVVDPRRTDVFVEENVGPLDEQALERLVADRLAPTLDPFKGPLIEIRLLRLGAQGDVFLLRGHHLVLDGWSMGVMLSDVFKSYLGIPLGPPSTMTHGRFLREFTGYGNQRLLAERENYFRGVLLPAPPLPNLGRVKKALKPNIHDTDVNPSAECIVRISRESRQHLLEKAKAVGVTDSSLFLASYAMVIGRLGGVDDVQINVPTANRTNRALADYVGWVSAMMPIRCKLRAGAGVAEIARELHTQFLKNAAHLPIDFAYLDPSGSIRQEQIKAGAFPNQFEGGMLVPEGLVNAVPIAPILIATSGESAKFAGVQIKSLPLPSVPKFIICELELRTYNTGNEYHYIANYDQSAFSRDEIVDMIRLIIENLGLNSAALEIGST
jgi:hypothetical protein